MPRLKIRRKQRKTDELAQYAAYLSVPIDCIFDWYGLSDQDLPQLAAAYDRYQEQLTGSWSTPGKRNAAFWLFEAAEDRNRALPEVEQLDRLGELSEQEITQLWGTAHGVRNELAEAVFRRQWGWWRFLAPQRRDYDLPELVQLTMMPDQLTKREAHILKHKRDLPGWPRGLVEWQRRTLHYLMLTGAERQFLKLPDN